LADALNAVAFSPKGRSALSGSCDKTLKRWRAAIGKLPAGIGGEFSPRAEFSPDGRFALSERGNEEPTSGELILWEVATGKQLRIFGGHTGSVWLISFSPDGRFVLSGSDDKTLKLWDVATGKALRSFQGHGGWVRSVAFSPDGSFAMSGSQDGTAQMWTIQTGQEVASMMATTNDQWLTITPKGFFSASLRDTDMVAIVAGMEVTTIEQVHQSLFNPDLVREALAGDPDGEVRRAAEIINLEKVLESGPPPLVEITSHQPGSRSDADLITLAARITDRGKGVGRIEWRVNGITVGVTGVPAGAGPDYEIKQQLALDPGENQIEVIAYDGRNLLASLPAQTTIAYTGPTDSVKPKLFILAIGINAYTDKGWTLPGGSQIALFPPLHLAVTDATSFADDMKQAAVGLYSEVRIKTALDVEATAEGLDRIFREMSTEIGPRDTFVLFIAAHGYSESGRYYLIPQDYQGGPDPAALASRAIGQDRLQDWIANRIKGKKAIILLDTCESGALTNGYAHSRVDAPASEAALGRLHEAIGRPVLAAAAAGEPAFEGYQGRGVFTWALIDALRNGDTNGKRRHRAVRAGSACAKHCAEDQRGAERQGFGAERSGESAIGAFRLCGRGFRTRPAPAEQSLRRMTHCLGRL
jgi:hypothetical protein